MRPSLGRLATLTAVAALSGCGYIGGPMPPLANIPAPVRDLAAIQRGDQIIAQFSIPLRTTENLPVEGALDLDLRIGPAGDPFNPHQWAFAATRAPQPPKPKGIARYEIASKSWVGKEVVIGVRVVGENGKYSDWSNFVHVQVVNPPEQPRDLRAESTPPGVHLTWRAAGEHFRVLRKAPGEQQFSVIAPDLRAPEYLDANAAVGVEEVYIVQGFLPLPDNKEAQSELSAEYKFTRLAPLPGAPTGLLAVPAPNSIELSWDSSPDAQTVGYRIFRAAPGADFVKLADVGPVPSYSDQAVEHGKVYRYAVSGLDKDGREGPRSAAVEARLP